MKLQKSPSIESMDHLLRCAEEMVNISTDYYAQDYLTWHLRRLALDFEWISSNVTDNASILEVGGYPFFLSSALSHKSSRLEVIDKISEKSMILTNRFRIKIVQCDIEQERLPYENSVFDEILFNEVFEHLRIDPIFTLNEIFRVLKPGGRLWLSTPNMGSIRAVYNLLFKNEAWSVVGGGVYVQYAHLRDNGWMGHVREYTSLEILDFLHRIGFHRINVIYRGEYTNYLIKLIAALNPRFLPYFSCIAYKP